MNVAIVLADFHAEISEKMLAAAKDECKKRGLFVYKIIRVTGAFDIPLPLKRLLANPQVHGAVVLGAVVQGETSHDEVVAYTSSEKIAQLSLDYDKPVGYGVSGPRMSVAQAEKRAEEFARRAVEAVARSL
ncbi:MAG: 6,7-dimethyl-8-ribityllumazine synthase [archaeon]|nr:6,7-dimethyl-8-ribityllumazine synthase [archaeon]